MGRFGTNLAPNLTPPAPGGRTGRASPRIWMALAAAVLAGSAVGCGAAGEETNTVPPSEAAVAAASISTTAPTTAAAVPPTTVAAAAPPTTAVPTTAAPTTAPAPTTAAPTTIVPPPTTAAPPEGTFIDLEVTDGRLEGGARREAARLGEEVTIRVSGDSADHVHIHGYDLFLHLTEGAGELVFTADIPGVFEIELEEAGVTLVQLEVS